MESAARKIATDLVQVIAEEFHIRWTEVAEQDMQGLGVNLLDVNNAIANCEVIRSNKENAYDANFVVHGNTTEGVKLEVSIRVSMDFAVYHVTNVSLAGAGE